MRDPSFVRWHNDKLTSPRKDLLNRPGLGRIEINPLALTKNEKLICLDAKINFDDNALYRHKDILKMRLLVLHGS